MPRYDNDYPFQREQRLTDIMNVPMKTGSATLDVINIQTSRLGVSMQDYCAGTGDGGGENEGQYGIHALVSEANNEYCAKRCMPHVSWCTFKAGLEHMEPHYKKSEALNRYLRRGITWSRLQTIAVLPVASGGLAMFTDGSRECVDFFKNAPPRLIEERPEATFDYMRWLITRQAQLAKLIKQDLDTRSLKGVDGRMGLETVSSLEDCILRHIDVVLMHKSLFLFHKIKSAKYIASGDSFDVLIKNTITNITATCIDDHVLGALHTSAADVAEVGLTPDNAEHFTWLELAVLLTGGVELRNLDDWMPMVVAYHQRVSLAMAAHVSMTAETLQRQYMPAAMLSKSANTAREGARVWYNHLLRLPDAALNNFEKAFKLNDTNMNQLSAFCDIEPPTLLWRGGGLFADLFIYMAVRFLAAPDHVLDAEGVHALWKWIHIFKRNITFKLLNALLKLQCYLRCHGRFPSAIELNPHLLLIGRGLTMQYDALRTSGTVASGAMHETLYRDRFNLNPMDVELMKAEMQEHHDERPRTPIVAYGNYIRFLFTPNNFYSLAHVGDGTRYFMVARTQAAPGKDIPHEGEAQGRSLSIAWFQYLATVDGGVSVCPCDGELGELKIVQSTIAEIAQGCGYFAPVASADDAEKVEQTHLSKFLNHCPMVHTAVRIGTDTEPWNFVLSEPLELEQVTFASRPLKDLTKMALARQLQLTEGFSDAARDDCWKLTIDVLLARLALVVDDEAIVAAVAKAKAKAKGKVGLAPKAKAKGLAPKAKAKGLAPKAKAKGKGGAAAKAKAKAKG